MTEPDPAASVPCIEPREERVLETVSAAIRQIRLVELPDLETIVKDTTIHETISVALSTIFGFLDCILQESVSKDDSPRRLAILGVLFDVSFLTVLFEHRKIFHRIAALSLASEPGSSVTIICWVDNLLSKLGDTSIAVASGVSLHLATPFFPGSAEFRAEEGLRAASQLPSNWHSVPGVIASNQASQAAKRLALRLTFAAFVIGPCMCSKSLNNAPDDFLEVLDRCLDQTRATGFSASPVGDQLAIQERLNFAMIVSLYSTSSRERRNQSRVRPHSLGCLLSIIQNVLHPNDPISSLQYSTPPEALDPAQAVLLRWGNTVSWCWDIWDDHRDANAESIVFLTSMWLYHSDVDFLPREPHAASTASSVAILRVLHQIVLSLSIVSPSAAPPLVSISVTSGACMYAVKSIQFLVCRQKEDERWIVSGFCKCLLSLFVLWQVAEDDEELVNNYIIEALSLVDSDTLHICLVHVQEDPTLRFVARLHERFVRASVSLTQMQMSKFDLVRSALSFAIIVWFSKTPGCLLQQSVSPLLSSVLELLLQQNPSSSASKVLGSALLTASSAARKDLSLTDENRKSTWQFATTSVTSDLSIASSFADYIVTSECLCDPLDCAEAWSCLGDVLLLMIKHHYTEEQEPLALLACPTICGAMIRLLQADASSTRFMLSTPFTLNLCADLKSVCEGDGSGEYFAFMKERLKTIGLRLLDQIRCRLAQTAPETPPPIPMRLMFYRMYGLSHLVFVPDM
ncbi:hypothetical protein DFH06DRAFT_1201391 [Mycena polygramma]|nr:hypothetical protein DFH06DRAFT_1201391 [Mycena polygramma]